MQVAVSGSILTPVCTARTLSAEQGSDPVHLEAGQRRDLVRADLDAAWLFDVLVALITQAAGNTRNAPVAPLANSVGGLATRRRHTPNS
jgi:hypothetical protein